VNGIESGMNGALILVGQSFWSMPSPNDDLTRRIDDSYFESVTTRGVGYSILNGDWKILATSTLPILLVLASCASASFVG
jgi:hypothetical protein